MPYSSKSQQRFMHAVHPDIAERWDKEGPSGYMKKLPKKINSNKDRAKAKLAHRNKGVARKTSFAEAALYCLIPPRR
jgi:hypothetical protein